ncbi:hypothetical protein [Pseudomonas sp. NPDC090592]|uniref:hypothetical protein n=1 Tax=Pseudomonas sp. NPDC090592 TaxID=3364480 RepID=UPI00383AA815
MNIRINPETSNTFESLRTGKDTFRYIICKLEENEVVAVRAVNQTELGTANDYNDNSKSAWEHFVANLKSLTQSFKECRYAAFRFQFMSNRGGAELSKMDKILFINLCPDDAPAKMRKIYTSNAKAVQEALGGNSVLALQVTDESELEHGAILSTLVSRL